MKKLLLSLSIIGIISGFTSPLSAQDTPSVAPIFITPYTATNINRTPTMVQATSNTNAIRGASRTYTQAGRVSKNNFPTKATNPFAGTGFLRIRGEKDYFDKVDGKYYNQYEYMGALAKRGDIAELQKVQSDLQQNGVYNPTKVQAAITAATQPQSTTLSPPTTTTLQDGEVASQPVQRPTYITKPQETSVPTKMHGGYDDDNIQTLDPAEAIKPKGPVPIFLR